MHAQMAATQMGAERILQTCEQFGVAAVMEAFAALLHGAAQELRAAIRTLPDGEASAEGFMDNDGVELDRPVRFAVTVRVKNGEIEFDFCNSDRQARGPVNLRPSMVEACVFYCLIGALDPKLNFNDGMREVVRFKYAPNTVTNASAPAPVSSYQAANLKLTDVILRRWRRSGPSAPSPMRGSSGALLISWKDGGRPGQPSLQYEILGSAYGGGNGNDGCFGGRDPSSNLHITPIEILESEFPCRIVEFDLVADSGGAGEYRGGLAFRRVYELLQDATVVRRYDRAKFPPNGVAGGKPGSRSRFVIHLGAENEQETPASGRYELSRRRALSAAERRRRRLRRSAKARSRLARARYRRRLHLGRGGGARIWKQDNMAENKKDRVGIVGAGRMGLSMLKHLVNKGYTVTVCDISEKQREAARAAGAAIAKAPAEVGKASDIVILGVGYDDEVNDVVFGKDGLYGVDGARLDHRGVVDREARHGKGGRGARCCKRHRSARRTDLPRPLCRRFGHAAWRWSAASPTWSPAPGRSTARSPPTSCISAMSVTARSARP